MDLTPLYQLMTLLFGLLGLALSIRTLPIWESESRFLFIEAWTTQSAVGRTILLIVPAFPFVFYVFCLISCFSPKRSRHQTTWATVIFPLATALFLMTQGRGSTVSKNAAITGGLWLAQHFSKPAQLSAKEDEAGSTEG